jgi:hypothetical protein
VNGQLPEDARDRTAASRGPSVIRRCALGIWLCGIALMGMVEFHRHALTGDGLSMTPVAWLWLAGSTATGVIGITLLVRELRRKP